MASQRALLDVNDRTCKPFLFHALRARSFAQKLYTRCEVMLMPFKNSLTNEISNVPSLASCRFLFD